jgi:KRAB domain-containing zinc finger protein
MLDISKAQFRPSSSSASRTKGKGIYRSIEHEIQIYQEVAETTTDVYVNIIEYWKRQQELLPRLASVAREILSIPATSASSERCFSAAGNVVTAERTLLDSERAEELIFIHNNYSTLSKIVKRWRLQESDFLEEEKKKDDKGITNYNVIQLLAIKMKCY